MSKKDQNNGNISFGEIGTIRNILMGEQMSHYEEKFRLLEEEFNQMKTLLAQQIEETKKTSSGDLEALKGDFSKQISALHQELGESKAELNQKIQTSEENQRKLFGKFLIDYGQKLLGV